MIKIKIGNKTFKGVYRWDDISLSQFCNLAAIPMPEGYEAYILADGKFSVDNIEQYIEAVSQITPEQVNVTFPKYYIEVIRCLSNVTGDYLNILTKDQINDMYEYYFKPFVVSLLYHAPVIHFMGTIKEYEPESVTSFKVGLQRFYLPESITIFDQLVPLAVEPILSYSEASDIFRGMKVSRGDVRRLALFMSIYCRKKGEKYDERKALERQELMMRVPMSVVWQVFFYTVRHLPDCSLSIRLFGSLPKEMGEVVDRVRAYKSMVVEH